MKYNYVRIKDCKSFEKKEYVIHALEMFNLNTKQPVAVKVFLKGGAVHPHRLLRQEVGSENQNMAYYESVLRL